MNNDITSLFSNERIVIKIKEKLPKLFQIAEAENTRDGKLGMEIGSARERILIALLICEFEEQNINANIPIAEREIDVIVFNAPISIKTFTNKNVVGVKLIWTVDYRKVVEFTKNYIPNCEMLLAHVNWNGIGALYLISKELQRKTLSDIGKENYFKLPKRGTNPRGIEISIDAMNILTNHHDTKKIEIFWKREKTLDFSPYERWLELWKE